MCGAFFGDLCTTMSISEKKLKEDQMVQNCDELPESILSELHGPAFDARYMSIKQPVDNDENVMDQTDTMDRKRSAGTTRPSFYVTDDHTEVLSEEPAWNINWNSFQSQIDSKKRRKRSLLAIGEYATEFPQQNLTTLIRTKRQNRVRSEPWQCDRKVKWEYLGNDYHPSHLRTVECTKPKCFWDQYDCKPRKFTVRILQRRRGVCADATGLKAYGFTGKSAEVWEFVQMAVNFCCDCVASKDKKRYY